MSTCTTRSGLDLIDSVHMRTVHKCGAIVDPLANLRYFSMRRSNSLIIYLNWANECEKDIIDAGAILAPNQILDTILRNLKECQSIAPYLTGLQTEYAEFKLKNPEKIFKSKSTAYVIDKLKVLSIDMNMPLNPPCISLQPAIKSASLYGTSTLPSNNSSRQFPRSRM